METGEISLPGAALSTAPDLQSGFGGQGQRAPCLTQGGLESVEICYFIKYEINTSGTSEMRKQAAIRQADILDVLRSSEAPMTAYQILGRLQEDEPEIAPPTVYRALTALTDQGRAHKLESLKAFVPCRCDHDKSLPVLTICDDCGLVEEHDGGTLLPQLTALIASSRFVPERHIVELHGSCRACAA